MRDAVAPQWLVEIVRPRRAPVPWPLMVRAALAICVPLAAGLLSDELTLGLLPAIGGLIAVTVDVGGPYRARVRRVGSATVFGGAVGLTIGTLIHGRGWIAVVVLVVIAGVSVVISDLGSIGSVTGLQLLVYTAFGFGPLGGLRPWWSGPLEFLIGVAWSMILIIPGWLLYPRAAEQHAVADVYRAQAARLRAVGTGQYLTRRRAVTAALAVAYDQLLTSRSGMAGADARLQRLGALLNQTHPISEAATALSVAGAAPPPQIANTLDDLADAIEQGMPPPAIPPCWDGQPTAQVLCDALKGAARLVAGKGLPDEPQPPPRGRRERLGDGLDKIRAGRLVRLFALRLMASMGVAAVVSEILPLQRSYWVVLTVAIVLKPDFGSVFARALQRGIGTVVGAVLGAVILAIVPYGPWLLIPFAVLAALLPYGRSRNYGLLSTFLTPLVVVLIDLLDRGGWHLAEARLIDTLIGCAVALLVGYAPWPSSWHARVPSQLAEAIDHVARYTERALIQTSADRGRLRRQTHRELSDLHAEFQRAMSEPPALSRQATAWWPALVGLEQVMDAVTATALTREHGAPAPAPGAVRQLTGVLDRTAASVRNGTSPPAEAELPADQALAPVTDAVRSVQAVLA
ncbi:MAG TPA: FUSC family protein [Streptosporangiaceae bacterium]|nr:FUSC family protein [Streptosporangiaceae bacterium]